MLRMIDLSYGVPEWVRYDYRTDSEVTVPHTFMEPRTRYEWWSWMDWIGVPVEARRI